MRITLTNDIGDLKLVEVNVSMTVDDLKALAQVELNAPVQALLHNGVILADGSKTLAEVSIVQDDIILVQGAPAQAADPYENARQSLLSNPASLRHIRSQFPEITTVINDPVAFRRFMERIQAQGQREEEERRRREQEEARMLANADPFDVEAQRKIEEAIKKENINKNWETAMEYHPESFGRVVMLYIPVKVNGTPVKAFVDSGAQATIMSPDCAERCKIMHLLDERFAGIAQGVGTAKILGRVHSAQMQVGSQFLTCSFTIMEGKGVELLFGLDMLKRHLACIDLEKNCLRINNEEIAFLPEHELPDQARELPAASSSSSGESAASPRANASSSLSSPSRTGGAGAGAGDSTAAPPAAAASPGSPAHASSVQGAGGVGGAGAAGAAAGGAIAGGGGASRFPEASIRGLMDLGVSRAEAIMALEQCNGDTDVAASLLLGETRDAS